MKSTFNKYLPLVLKIVLAALLIQTLRFKFTAHEDSVYIFNKLGMEPWGRILIGVFELIASILLFVPRINLYGIILTVGLMFGAIFLHLTKLGIVVKEDGGALFGMAVLCLSIALALLFLYKDKLKDSFQKLFNS